MVPFDLLDDDVTWVSSNLPGAAVGLVAEALELRNWLICVGSVSKDLISEIFNI